MSVSEANPDASFISFIHNSFLSNPKKERNLIVLVLLTRSKAVEHFGVSTYFLQAQAESFGGTPKIERRGEGGREGPRKGEK